MSSFDDITELLLEISYLRQLQQCILANTCVFVKVQIEVPVDLRTGSSFI